MELYGTLNYDNRNDKVWIFKVTNKDDFKMDGEFLKRVDLNYNERKNNIKTKDNKYVYKFLISEKGIYRTHNIDGIDDKFKTRYVYIDPKANDGVVILSTLIKDIIENKMELSDIKKIMQDYENSKKSKK